MHLRYSSEQSSMIILWFMKTKKNDEMETKQDNRFFDIISYFINY